MEFIPNIRQNKTSKIRVGVLRGGPSGEYDVSLKTGGAVLEHLPEKYHPMDIFIDQNGKWHLEGMVCRPEKAINRVDVVFNGLHGEYGEDGQVQRILEHFKVPYTGSRSLSSALAMNKVMSKKIFEKENLKTPKSESLKKQDANYLRTFEIWNSMRKPAVIKPVGGGSSLGIVISNSMETFSESLRETFKHYDTVLIEEFIDGREVTCAVVEGFNAEYVLPVVEIKPKNSNFFDYKAKYSGETEKICPADFPENQLKEIQGIALVAHRALGLRHYSRTDMIVANDNNDGEIYVLETNTLPGLTPESLLPKSLKAHGSNLSEFLDHIINMALLKR